MLPIAFHFMIFLKRIENIDFKVKVGNMDVVIVAAVRTPVGKLEKPTFCCYYYVYHIMTKVDITSIEYTVDDTSFFSLYSCIFICGM